MDMAGNVWDWYEGDYYLTSPHENPFGPDNGTQKVIRGGIWTSRNNELRLTNREKADPQHSNDSTGFRCVLPELTDN